MEPNQPPTRSNPEIAMKEMELKVLSKFLSSDRQKTEITPDQRVLILVLDGMAEKPYPISKSIAERLKIKFNPDDFRIDFLKDFLKDFIEYGIPLNRTGRTEEVRVLEGYFNAQRQQDDSQKQQNITTKLMK